MTDSGGQSELLAFALVGWVFGAAIAPEVLIPPCVGSQVANSALG